MTLLQAERPGRELVFRTASADFCHSVVRGSGQKCAKSGTCFLSIVLPAPKEPQASWWPHVSLLDSEAVCFSLKPSLHLPAGIPSALVRDTDYELTEQQITKPCGVTRYE